MYKQPFLDKLKKITELKSIEHIFAVKAPASPAITGPRKKINRKLKSFAPTYIDTNKCNIGITYSSF